MIVNDGTAGPNYTDWRTFVKNVVVPAVEDDANTPDYPATVEWERVCAEQQSFLLASMYFMWHEITMLQADKKDLIEILDRLGGAA